MDWMRVLKPPGKPLNWVYLEVGAIAIVVAVIVVAYAVSRLAALI